MRGPGPVGPEPFDVAVLGGGIMGASTALALARGGVDRRPRRTLLVDAFEPGHTRGSSHGDGRIVRFTYAEAVYLELARRAYARQPERSMRRGPQFSVRGSGRSKEKVGMATVCIEPSSPCIV